VDVLANVGEHTFLALGNDEFHLSHGIEKESDETRVKCLDVLGIDRGHRMRRSFVRAFGQSPQAIQRTVRGLIPRVVGRSKPKWQRAKESFETQLRRSPR
jgi:hypothetical protein